MRTLTIVSLLSTAFLAGCGYKGPLEMPQAKAEAKQSGTLKVPEPPPERPVPAQSVPPPK